MPLRQLTCPHCEQLVELHVTSVTRSRECPVCGKPIILQFTTKESRMKRRALLVPADVIVEDEPASFGPAQALNEEEVLERMTRDPEVRHSQRRFLMGGGMVLGLILLLVLAHHFQWWSSLGQSLAKIARQPAPAVVEEEDLLPRVLDPPKSRLPKLKLPDDATAVTAPPKTEPEKPAVAEQERALKAVGAFLNAKNVEERVKTVRDQRIMEPLMREYYTKHPDGPIAFERVESREVNPEGNFTYAFNVVLPDGTGRRAIVGKGASGDYFFDWASFVIYSQKEWMELRLVKPSVPVLLRTLIQPGEHYAGAFMDPLTYSCLKLTNPLDAQSPPLYAYLRRNTPAARAMDFILRNSTGEPLPAVLTVKYPTGGASDAEDQVLIDEVICEGWVTRGR